MIRHRSSTIGVMFAAGVVWFLFALSGCSEDNTLFFDPSSRLEEIVFQDGIFPD